MGNYYMYPSRPRSNTRRPISPLQETRHPSILHRLLRYRLSFYQLDHHKQHFHFLFIPVVKDPRKEQEKKKTKGFETVKNFAISLSTRYDLKRGTPATILAVHIVVFPLNFTRETSGTALPTYYSFFFLHDNFFFGRSSIFQFFF